MNLPGSGNPGGPDYGSPMSRPTARNRLRLSPAAFASAGAVALAIASGCGSPSRAVPESPIAYAHIAGDFLTELQGDCETLAAATAAALRRAGVNEVRTRADRERGSVTGRTKSGERVAVRLRPIREGVVQMAVRWGTFGDEAASERLARELSPVPAEAPAPR